MDQVGEAIFKISETLAHISESSVKVPEARNNIEMGISDVVMMVLHNPDHQGPSFPSDKGMARY